MNHTLTRQRVQRICTDGVLIALYFVLTTFSLRMGNLRITFASLIVIVGNIAFLHAGRMSDRNAGRTFKSGTAIRFDGNNADVAITSGNPCTGAWFVFLCCTEIRYILSRAQTGTHVRRMYHSCAMYHICQYPCHIH